jgi:hypothetical protein
MDFIEEKSPRGIILKVLTKKWNFLAFDQKGSSIFSDSAGTKALHRVPLVAFVGENFQIKNTGNDEFSFLKVMKQQVVVPYVDRADNSRKYIFLPWSGAFDILPVRLRQLRDVAALVREIEAGEKPDQIIVNKSILNNDIIIIKNRFADTQIIIAGAGSGQDAAQKSEGEINEYADRRATEVMKEVNINMMSGNPVFLARVHLREMDLAKVNQIILDFDLSALEAEYISSFIATMLQKEEADEDIRRSKSKLVSMNESLLFYISLLNKDDSGVRSMIARLPDSALLASFSTLVAKVKLLYPGTDDQLTFTDYENLLWEKKSEIQDR